MGKCPILGQPFNCLEDGCAWWDTTFTSPWCAVLSIAFRLLALESLDEASILTLEVQEHVGRIKALEEKLRDVKV